jgi:Uma2 family endonuclease
MEVLTKKMTYAEYSALEFDDQDNTRYELINGEIVKKASPTVQHQRISMRLIAALLKYLETNATGELFHAPLDVVLDDYNAPQPDIFYIGKDKSFIIDEEEQVVRGTPDLIVEILSPGSIQRDRFIKKQLYEQFGIAEYWIVDPNNQAIEVYKLTDGKYELLSFAAQTGAVTSGVLQDFSLDITPLFQ